ncbi:MAG: DUF4093 domain-containing protein [Clostridia bacterium]|nr:DUF4093 domain-containing protein [Clostridia bacterium]
MIPLRPVILVEGKYDKIKLSQIFDATILTTEGFGIFKQKEKTALLRRLAETCGLLIFTDADGAGLVIRNYLKGAIPSGTVYHAYLPPVKGKERRKAHPSGEGLLGVEGVSDELIIKAVRDSGALDLEPRAKGDLTKANLYDLGLSGTEGSTARRKAVMRALSLPENLSANALLDVLNCVTDQNGLRRLLKQMPQR